MDAFGDDFTSAGTEVDPAAEFLAREQDQLAGLEDDLLAEPNDMPAAVVAEPVPAVQEDGFLTDAFDVQQPPAFMAAQEESIDQFGADAFGSTLVADDGFANTNGFPNNASTPVMAHRETITSLPREEPEKILKWREEQKLRLQLKDEEEERKKTEMKEHARKELEEWYKHHKETVEKTRAANRNAEKDLVSQSVEPEPGQEWERIAKLCDFNPKASRNSKDVSRMRSIILQLKQSPPACTTGQ